MTGRDCCAVTGRGPTTVTMGERKREAAQGQKLSRRQLSVDNISRPREASAGAAAAAAAAAAAGVSGAGAGGGGGDRGGDGDGGVVVRERDRTRGRDRQSAYLNRDTTGKPNRFGWRSWSSHRLSDLSAKKVFGWLREPSSGEFGQLGSGRGGGGGRWWLVQVVRRTPAVTRQTGDWGEAPEVSA